MGGLGNVMALTVESLVVAGGGSGASSLGGCTPGAGGAGGYVASSTMILAVGSYGVTVGSGGSPIGTPPYAQNGGNSVLGTITAIGGGHGGSPGNTGGSGGSGVSCGGTEGSHAGTAGQGNASGSTSAYQPGGGGGAGGAGTNGSSGGAGGVGTSNSISGSAVTYAKGGDGNGGGANCSATNRGYGGNASFSGSASGGTGCSGVVIVKCLTSAVTCTGGTITTSGAYTINTFNSNGTLVIAEASSPSSLSLFGDF